VAVCQRGDSGDAPVTIGWPNRCSEVAVDQDQPDKHLQDREAEKLADLASLADVLAAFRQLGRELDQWERVHLARV